MKRKLIAALLVSAMAVSLAACGSSEETKDVSTNSGSDTTTTSNGSAADADEGSAAADGELIKVGIINNDPNESGYRTANDADMKKMFTEDNGYEADVE